MIKFFLSNLQIYKNVDKVKCKRVETEKKYGSKHRISPKTGPKQPKMVKNDPNSVQFKNFDYFPQNFTIIDPVHSSMVFRIEFSQKPVNGCYKGLARDPKWPKTASK